MLTKEEQLYKVQDKVAHINMDKKLLKEIITAYQEVIFDGLVAGEEVSLGKIGRFRIVQKSESVARNPRTGEKIIVPPHKVVRLTMSEKLKEGMK